eukprot:1151675-Pelagomonas_calceolata.AAC.3
MCRPGALCRNKKIHRGRRGQCKPGSWVRRVEIKQRKAPIRTASLLCPVGSLVQVWTPGIIDPLLDSSTWAPMLPCTAAPVRMEFATGNTAFDGSEWPRGDGQDDDDEDDDRGCGGAPAPGGRRYAGRAPVAEQRRALHGNQQQQGGGSHQQYRQQQQLRKQRCQRQLNMLHGCTGSTEDLRGDDSCGRWAAVAAAAAAEEGAQEAGSPQQVRPGL